ncbi:MAG: lipid-A-disaccharide synthase N-terminal domain-containing protein [Phycisphaeraceae bacterium]
MTQRPAFKRWIVFLAVVLATGFALLVLSTGSLLRLGPAFELSDRLADLPIVATDDGGHEIVFDTDEGELRYSAEAFVEELAAKQKQQENRGWLYRIFDITSWTGILWVAFGLGGQVLFTGRMIIQWIASEKRKQSVVPVAFWWMSLTGATMLMMYFIWRVDIVGVLGQSTGWFIYARNLALIYRPGPHGDAEPTTPQEDPAPEPVAER